MADSPPPPCARPQTAWQVHLAAYLLLGGLLLYVLVARYLRPLVLSDGIGVEADRQQVIEQQIDPNTAPWPELARLPGVGEALAKRIVAYRETHAPTGGGAVFRTLQDLDQVSGLGPKTLERIEPCLKFPSAEDQGPR